MRLFKSTLKKSALAFFGITHGSVTDFSTTTKYAGFCSFIKYALKLIGKCGLIILAFLGPYWHKLILLLVFNWTLYLHSCIGLVGNQDTNAISCPDGYAYRLKPEDWRSEEHQIKSKGLSEGHLNKATPTTQAHVYIRCEDYDAYMNALWLDEPHTITLLRWIGDPR